MLSWAQRTAQWTVKTLPFSIGRSGDPARAATDAEAPADQAADEALAEPAETQPERAASQGSRHRASHERSAAPPVRGRHAAPSRSRRTRTEDAG
jgi:hypothetical protein